MNAAQLFFCSFLLCLYLVSSFLRSCVSSINSYSSSSLQMAQCQFPGGKKAEGKAGEALKAVVTRAKYNAPYGCEEGKCGSCEHKVNGKKIRLCVGKVPAGDGPHVFTQ